jgi:hypothetical protein
MVSAASSVFFRASTLAVWPLVTDTKRLPLVAGFSWCTLTRILLHFPVLDGVDPTARIRFQKPHTLNNQTPIEKVIDIYYLEA